MNNPNVKLILRVIVGVIYGAVAIKFFLSGDYLFSGLFLVCGIVFIAQALLKKKGDR